MWKRSQLPPWPDWCVHWRRRSDMNVTVTSADTWHYILCPIGAAGIQQSGCPRASVRLSVWLWVKNGGISMHLITMSHLPSTHDRWWHWEGHGHRNVCGGSIPIYVCRRLPSSCIQTDLQHFSGSSVRPSSVRPSVAGPLSPILPEAISPKLT